jgi:hypothetical protein
VQVSRIRRRFAEEGVAGLRERPKSGRPPPVSARKRAQIVALTLKPPGRGVTHWTTRDLARTAGVSHSTVHRIWQAHALQPHRVTTFNVATDPDAETKIHDVVGLYLNPPTNAVVLGLDEKTQIQALSRTPGTRERKSCRTGPLSGARPPWPRPARPAPATAIAPAIAAARTLESDDALHTNSFLTALRPACCSARVCRRPQFMFALWQGE